MSLQKKTPWIVLLIASAGITCWQVKDLPGRAAEQLSAAQEALKDRRYEQAEVLAQALIVREGSESAALIAGEAAMRQGHFDDAVRYYRKAAAWACNATARSRNLFYLGEAAVHAVQLNQAENAYRASLAENPDNTVAAARLENLFRMEGRLIESRRLLQRQITANSAGFEQALNFGHPHRIRGLSKIYETHMDSLRSDHLPLIALAREHVVKKRSQAAIQNLTIVIEEFPECVDAQSLLGTILMDEDESRFVSWFQTLPDVCRDESSVWMLRGLYAERHSNWNQAARAYCEVLRKEPSSRLATRHMAIVLGQLQYFEVAAAFRDRATAGSMVESLLDDLYDDKHPQTTLNRLIPLLISSGRLDEAANWIRLGAERFGPRFANGFHTQVQSARNDDMIVGELLDSTPVRDFPIPVPMNSMASSSHDRPSAPIQFRRRAQEIGFDFRFINAPQSSGRRRMVQSNGGGSGIIDFDHDSWPDILMTQGGVWPVDPAQKEPADGDQLFRNLRGRAVADVTSQSGVADLEFSQGIAVSDADGDGFQDVFVANVGSNRLLSNNGDGTFSDVTQAAGIRGKAWSTSCTFADLNADGFDDLYVVNYLSLLDAAAGICAEEGKLKRCTAGEFEAAADQLLLNAGDGTFHDVSHGSGIVHQNGRGLGVAAVDWNLDGNMDVFVANDAVPNFLLLNQLTTPGSMPHFVEAAVASGVAVSCSGEPQACMGVAVADFDHNLQPDVFVTNFLNESNTMYFGVGNGLFVDRSLSLGLTTPSMDMLGFGTQPIDLELDGFADIVVLNGHIDDMTAAGVAYQMPIQFFRNQKGLDFRPAQPTSDFLTARHVGRSMAVTDWNRDGKQDLVIGLLDEPSCILENDTPTDSDWLQIRLVGDHSARQANGTRVTVATSDAQHETAAVMQIAGGGGFQAANDMTLTFGLGNDAETCTVTVHWLNGAVSTLKDMKPGQSVTILQRSAGSVPWTVPR